MWVKIKLSKEARGSAERGKKRQARAKAKPVVSDDESDDDQDANVSPKAQKEPPRAVLPQRLPNGCRYEGALEAARLQTTKPCRFFVRLRRNRLTSAMTSE